MPACTGAKKKNGTKSSSSSQKNQKSAKKKGTPKCPEYYVVDHLKRIRMNNVVRFFDSCQHGNIKSEAIGQMGENLVSEKLKNFDVYELDPGHFDRRITALQFHPTNPFIIGIGSKSGMVITRFLNPNGDMGRCAQWIGRGPGCSITSISFSHSSPNMFSTSIDGTVRVLNYVDLRRRTLLDTGSFSSWYCSVNASNETGLVVAGDSIGYLKILNKDFKQISQHRLHKKKVNSIDFCKNKSWLFATASLDHSVKLWDIRKLEEKTPLEVREHIHPVNSAYFSRTDGNRLLSTDQNSELRVFTAPLFELESVISHPHRQFQHLTPIRATWHPLCDLAVVGRYPDPSWPTYESELRTVDLISVGTRSMKAQLTSVACEGIISLNVFNVDGEILASAMGMFVPYWRFRQPFESTYKMTDAPKDDPRPDEPKDDKLKRPRRNPAKKKKKVA